MARTSRHDSDSDARKRRYDRSHARKLLKDFERQYILSNKDSQIYL